MNSKRKKQQRKGDEKRMCLEEAASTTDWIISSDLRDIWSVHIFGWLTEKELANVRLTCRTFLRFANAHHWIQWISYFDCVQKKTLTVHETYLSLTRQASKRGDPFASDWSKFWDTKIQHVFCHKIKKKKRIGALGEEVSIHEILPANYNFGYELPPSTKVLDFSKSSTFSGWFVDYVNDCKLVSTLKTSDQTLLQFLPTKNLERIYVGQNVTHRNTKAIAEILEKNPKITVTVKMIRSFVENLPWISECPFSFFLAADPDFMRFRHVVKKEDFKQTMGFMSLTYLEFLMAHVFGTMLTICMIRIASNNRESHLDELQFLLENGCDPNASCLVLPNIPSHHVLVNKHIFDWESNRDLQQDITCPLMLALYLGKYEWIELLLQHGANPLTVHKARNMTFKEIFLKEVNPKFFTGFPLISSSLLGSTQ